MLLSGRVTHRVSKPIIHAGEHVTVRIEGDGDGRVAQKFLHELGVDAAGEQDRGARVPEVVEADRRQARALQGPLERAVGQQVGAEEAAGAIGEDETAILPESTDLEPLDVLGGSVALESLDGGAC